MRSYVLCGLGLALALTNSADAAWPTGVRDHRGEKPDLTITNVFTNGSVVQVAVKNIGQQPSGKVTKLRVQMFRRVNGQWQLQAAYFADVPALAKGALRYAYVTMPTRVSGSRLICDVDVLNQLSESNENNNRFVHDVP